jgi:2-polyprenyl-3-methyl-5-hydroxy-6-metoxy-1,4-benzoquinol methylase
MKKTNVATWKEHWNNVGDKYRDPWNDFGVERINNFEKEFIKNSVESAYINDSKMNLLDIGIGNGRILEVLSQYVEFPRDKLIYGVDFAQTMVDFCNNKFSGDNSIKDLKLVNVAEEEIPFNIKFNAVTMIRVLKYIPNWQEIILKITKSIDDGGVFVFTMPNNNSINRFAPIPGNISRTTVSQVKRLISNSGVEKSLSLEEIRGFSILPDAFYRVPIKLFVKLVCLFDRFLISILGYRFSRILFFKLRVN